MAQVNYTVIPVNTDNVGLEDLSVQDKNVLDSYKINSSFDQSKHRIELHIYGLDGTLLFSLEDRKSVV